jgi:hypothetical protein
MDSQSQACKLNQFIAIPGPRAAVCQWHLETLIENNVENTCHDIML